MPKESRTSRYEAEEGFTNGLFSSTHKAARRSSGIESSNVAGGSRSARRRGGGSTTKTVTFTQKMPVPSQKSYRKHRTERTDVRKRTKVETEHRRRHQTSEDQPESEDDYVYPLERRSKKEKRPHYEEVRRLGRDGEDERRRRADQSKSSHHQHHRHHKHHHRHREREEQETPREHRPHHRQRTPEEQREHDERRAERRARRAEREDIEVRNFPPSSRTHREKHAEPVTRSGFFGGLFKRYIQALPLSSWS